MNRSLWLLALCQGLFLTNNVTFIAINGLVGLSLAPVGWMATLPVMGRLRTRLPVRLATALAKAGTMVAVTGSPMPPGFSLLLTNTMSTRGDSLVRTMG